MKKILLFFTTLIILSVFCVASVFASDVSGFEVEEDEDKLTYIYDVVNLYGTNAVATIGEAEYSSLQDAIDAAQNGETITILCDITLDTPIVVAKESNAVLDMAGKTINAGWGDESASKHIYAFTNYGTLTITGNGTINARGTYNYGTLTLKNGTINAIDGNGGYGVKNYNGATFIMNGGLIATTYEDDNKVSEGGYDATPILVDAGATLVINGGEINNICDFTVALLNYGTVTIKAGTFTSVHSTISNSGDMTIEGGEFKCDGLKGVSAHIIVAYDGSTTTIIGGTFDGKDNYNGFTIDALNGAVVTVTGGTFLPVHSGSLYGEGKITVSGGTFFDKIPTERCEEGYAPTLNADGTYGIVLSLERAFTFLGYSVNEKDWNSITAGYTVNQDVIALYLEQNNIGSFDIGCAFGIDSIKKTTSFEGYTEYKTFNVKIGGIDSTNEEHINASLVMALYVDLGAGKNYVVKIDDAIQLVEAEEIPFVVFKTFMNAQ